MNPDGNDELQKLINSIMDNGGFAPFLENSYKITHDQMWESDGVIEARFIQIPPTKFEFGDVVITRTGKTGVVKESFYDEDCEYNIVVFTNSDTYNEGDLSLICSTI